jgi:SAM-dependent methyltransferase
MASMERTYFDEMYKTDIDPWQFESSWYEQRKYALTMAALPDVRYRSAFEPGCSVGVLSRLLAERCDYLLATDIVPAVLERARQRCRPVPTANFELRAIPEAWPVGPFDLVVLSEIAYYFDRPALSQIMTHVLATTTPSATIVSVHWRGETNYPLTGDEAHAVIDREPWLRRDIHHVEPDFVLDVWTRP